ncbi:MAG: HAMP domain-containing sensor histidine kinase [Acidobacteriota bacterium]
MRVRRVPLGVVLPGLLVGLVAVLATLQYRWLGQVSEAEREQLRRSFSQRAREFADEFDLEIARAYGMFQLSQPALSARDWTSFAAAVDRWHATARFPQMVRRIHLAEAAGGQLGLRAYDRGARAFADETDIRWPARLEPVRVQLAIAKELNSPVGPARDVVRLETSREPPSRLFTIAMAMLNAEVPALIIPVMAAQVERPGASGPAGTGSAQEAHTGAGRRGTFVWLQQRDAHLIIELDDAYLGQTVLPALAEAHFPEPGAATYRIAVLAHDGSTLLARGLGEGATIDPAAADLVVPLMTFRLDLAWGFMPGPGSSVMARRTAAPEGDVPPGGSASTFETRTSVIGVTGSVSDGRSTLVAASGAQLRVARPAWRLVLQHGAGSLDAAVTRARHRNLLLSFGILAVLSAGMVLVVLNARRLEQLAARQMEFVATVSHELRTPLTVIRSAAQNLSAGVVADQAHTRQYGELIDKEGRRLTDMVEQVLDYAGLTGNGSLRLTQLTDAGALVDDVMASCQSVVAQAGCRADVSVEDELYVMADQGALRRAVQNLVGNALKHGADGQWVGVTAKSDPETKGADIVIAISDRGRGIPAAELPHIFEPFYRGRHAIDRQVHGNGLGLSLVKRIVDAHGGRLTVRSAAGEGTTFTMILPAAGEAATATAAGAGLPG